jgi:hypothetical protein
MTGRVRAPGHLPTIGRELRSPDRRPFGAEPPGGPVVDRPDPEVVIGDEGEAVAVDRRIAKVGP